MFLHDTHLPQTLDSAQYTSPERFQREMDLLFRGGWNCVGVTDDLPNEGDFFTFELLGRPLIVWRIEGKVRAFLNICPHRFSVLTEDACGHAGDRLKCRYHGWEFDCNGDTKRIPDAASFKPLAKGELGLTEFRTETIGQLIYVTFSEDSPSLAEFLGPARSRMEEIFSPPWRHFFTYDYEVDGNWKIKTENALESYHVTEVHGQTFGETPDAAICYHELEPEWSIFRQEAVAPKRIDRILDRAIHRIAGVSQDEMFEHNFYYPNLFFAKVSLYCSLESLYPVAPDRTRIVQRYFCNPGDKGLRSRVLFKGMRAWGRKFFKKVAQEDASVFAGIQRGHASDVRPSAGLISIREERLWHFQEYIRRRMNDDDQMTNDETDTATKTRTADMHPQLSKTL